MREEREVRVGDEARKMMTEGIAREATPSGTRPLNLPSEKCALNTGNGNLHRYFLLFTTHPLSLKSSSIHTIDGTTATDVDHDKLACSKDRGDLLSPRNDTVQTCPRKDLPLLLFRNTTHCWTRPCLHHGGVVHGAMLLSVLLPKTPLDGKSTGGWITFMDTMPTAWGRSPPHVDRVLMYCPLMWTMSYTLIFAPKRSDSPVSMP